MSWGSIYSVSWFGNTNEAIGWGFMYPTDADGSFLTSDTNIYKADSTTIKTDATEF